MIFIIALSLRHAYAIEMSGGGYSIDAVAFANGGGPTTSSTHMMVMSIIGEGLIPLGESSSGQFSLLAGQVQLIYGLDEALDEEVDWLISEISARTDVLGERIPEKTWQKDADPYLSWGILVDPPALIDGFSVSVDTAPDSVIDTFAPSYQFPDAGIPNGRHTIYVVPFYSSGIPETESTRPFEIWLDKLAPYVNQITPSSGSLVPDSRVAISCRISDADSGVDASSLRMELNGRTVSARFDAESGVYVSQSEEYVSEGRNTVMVSFSDTAANAATQAWEFIADSQPPRGTFTVNNGAEITHSAYVSLYLDASDATSAVTGVLISNDGIFDTESNHPYAYQPVISNWLLMEPDADGVKTVYVKFRDAAGNTSGAYADQIHLHRLTPDTRLLSGPAAATEETDAAFTFESTRQGSKFSMRLDNQPWSQWGSNREVSFSGLAQGNHYFFVKSGYDLNADGAITIDEEDPTPAQWIWTVGDEEALNRMREKILFWKR